MKLLKKILIAVVILLSLFLGIKRYAPSLNAVYPQQCTFLIDEQFSAPFQARLQGYVSKKYESSKDLQQIFDDVSATFDEVENMDAYVCKTDNLCFTFDGAKPLFLLNEFVVCNNLRLLPKEHYREDVIDGLHKITVSCFPDIAKIVDFVAHVPAPIFQDFDVNWNSEDEVVLSLKNKKLDTLLFCMTNQPTLEAIALFKQAQLAKKNNKKQVYDFRFNNQIIIK